MHTQLALPSGCEIVRSINPTGPFVALVLLVALLLGPTASRAQTGFPGAPEDPGGNLRVYPLDTWSPRVGFGLGAGLVLHHLGRTNAQGLLTFAPAWHEQVATAAWASADPHRAEQYVLVSARGLHTNRDWFYGLGPTSSKATRLSIQRTALQARVRAGQAFLNHRLVVQPHLGLSSHRIDQIPMPIDPSLDPASRSHLQNLATEDVGILDPELTGLRVGMAVVYDTRPRHSRPNRGLLLEGRWSRYLGISSSLIRFDEFDLGAYGHLPLGGDHRLSGRLRLTLIEPRGQAPIPYYLRPTLDGPLVPGWARHRFVASDRLLGSALYRFPIADLFEVVNVEGHLGAHAANVYGDFPADAAFDLTTAEPLSPDPSSIPLRPSASVGLHVGLSFRQTPSLDLALGLSPEGLTGVRFTFRQDLLALRPPHHKIRLR